MGDARTLLVPDGLDGERVDAAMARLFGFSRTKACEPNSPDGRSPSTAG
jgi:23S rRNA pseudouridine1911/1915/1917 synthase